MPIYNFICQKCQKTEERLVKNQEQIQYCDCEDDTIMIRDEKIQSSSFVLKGNWFKNNKSY